MAVQMTALTLETDWHNYFFFIFNLSYEKCEKLKKIKAVLLLDISQFTHTKFLYCRKHATRLNF